jgi:anion-transporting  ArsA/GET3 family ATPase
MSRLLDRKLLVITGKGGVGRTTVAAALGLVAAGRGRRAIVVEVGEQERLASLFDRPPLEEREEPLADGLWGISIDPQAALREWLVTRVGGALVRLLADSRTFQYFYAAAPGAREMATIVKVWELTQARRWDRAARSYDLVVLDAPATGHALGLLRTPRTLAELARVGPIRAQADRVWSLLTDRRRSGYLAVATAHEMPVTETLELEQRLREQLGRRLGAVLVNGVYPRRFSAEELERLAALDGRPLLGAARAAARSHAARVRTQQGQLRRLRRQTEATVATLPFVFAPQLGRGEVERLAAELERKLAAR